MSKNATASLGDEWYAVYVRYQNEYKIADFFREKLGMEARVPSQRLWRKKGGEKEFLTKPILDTYVFIRTNLDKLNRRLFYSVGGVIDLVRHSGRPAPVPQWQIESLEKLASSNAPLSEIEYKRYKPNDMVEVTRGPLRGAVGYFMKTSERSGRLIVSVDLFHRSLVTEIDPRHVRPY